MNIAEQYAPATFAELVEVVAKTTETGHELHARGSGWSYENAAVSSDRVVSLENLTLPLTEVLDQALTDEWRVRQDAADGSARLFHVQAGIEIGMLNLELERRGLAMPTLGGANGQTLSGAFSTSTHGGDFRQPPLPDFVRALHIVTHGGQEVWLEPAGAPITTDERLRPLLCPDAQIRRDSLLFTAALVSLGRFGVIYAVVVEVTKAFRLAEWTVRRSGDEVIDALERGIAANTGLANVLGSLPGPPAALNADTVGGEHFVQILFNSQDPDEALITRRWRTIDVEDLNSDQEQSGLCHSGVANLVLLGAAEALKFAAPALALVPIVGLVWSGNALASAHRLELAAVDPHLSGGEAMALALNALWASNLGVAVPPLAWLALNGQFGPSEDPGRRGPSHLITSNSRNTNQSDCYRGVSTEIVFAADDPRYLNYLRLIRSACKNFEQAGYISLRFSAPSQARLSMHNFPGAPLVVSIEIASAKGLVGNDDWLTFVQGMASGIGGRTHWGQVNRQDERLVARAYGADLVLWRQALMSLSGASMVFSNAFTRRRGLEPYGLVREVTATGKRPEKGQSNITALGGQGGAGGRWEPVHVELAEFQIESGSVEYYVSRPNGERTPITVVHGAYGKYLRSWHDETGANNLDNLPDIFVEGRPVF